MKSFCALLQGTHSVQTRVELAALPWVGALVDAILSGTVAVSGLGPLEFGLALALVFSVLHVITGVLGVNLGGVEHQTVGAQLSRYLSASALKIPVTLLGVGKKTLGLRTHKVYLGLCHWGEKK